VYRDINLLVTDVALRRHFRYLCQKLTDGAAPQTVQRGPACFHCRSRVGLEFFGRLFAWTGSWT